MPRANRYFLPGHVRHIIHWKKQIYFSKRKPAVRGFSLDLLPKEP